MSWMEILKKTDAVLFDLDGTVVDSMWIWKQIDIDYFKKCDLVMPDTYQKEIEGLSFYETAKYTHDHYIPFVSIEELMANWNEMAYEHYASKVKAKECIQQFLEYLKNNNYRIGIATSNSSMLCHLTLRANDLIEYFDIILTGEGQTAGKPAPDVYLECAKRLGVSPARCLVFEDLSNGIRAGNAAGMTTVAIHDDYSEYQWDEKKSLADYSIMSYREIIDEISES